MVSPIANKFLKKIFQKTIDKKRIKDIIKTNKSFIKQIFEGGKQNVRKFREKKGSRCSYEPN